MLSWLDTFCNFAFLLRAKKKKKVTIINNVKRTHLITSFPKSDWYVTGSVPVPNRASLAVGGVKSTIKPSEAASI